MEQYPRKFPYQPGQKCSVKQCNQLAEYEVVLYDFYDFFEDPETFYEQDYTCPFLCEDHMKFNEDKAKGERRPRGVVYYPFTNQHTAQGYSKYNPIKEVYPQFFESVEENNKIIQVDLSEINEELIKYLSKHPEYLRQLNPRKFEELIAEIVKKMGYEVSLTPKSKDGGKDIIALYKSPIGHQMFIFECKRYSEENKVGVELVRGLYGVKTAENYNKAVLVTTSTFTKGARDFVKPLKLQLDLKDFNDVTEWCKIYSTK